MRDDSLLSDHPFTSFDALRQRFIAGLDAMLELHHDLGVYILVLANAAQDPLLWRSLSAKLIQRHQHHAAAIRQAVFSETTFR
jgi:hypothetical protein